MITLANAIYGAKHKQLHQVWNNLPCQQILHCWFRVHFEQIEPERGRHTLRIASGRCWQVALKHLSSSLSAFEPFALGLLIVTVDLRYWWGCEDTAELRWPLTSLYMSYRDTDWAVICCKKLWFHISLLWWLSLQRWMRNVQLYNHVILLYQPKPYETSSWTDYILIQSKTATRILKYKCFERINSPWLFTVMSELEASWTRVAFGLLQAHPENTECCLKPTFSLLQKKPKKQLIYFSDSCYCCWGHISGMISISLIVNLIRIHWTLYCVYTSSVHTKKEREDS